MTKVTFCFKAAETKLYPVAYLYKIQTIFKL